MAHFSIISAVSVLAFIGGYLTLHFTMTPTFLCYVRREQLDTAHSPSGHDRVTIQGEGNISQKKETLSTLHLLDHSQVGQVSAQM